MEKFDFREADARAYVSKYRDAERFMALCRGCDGYGRTWACPPFDFDPADRMAPFSRVTLVVWRHRLPPDGVDVAASRSLIAKFTERFEPVMIDLEAACGGLAFSFCGSCRRCDGCTRPAAPCRFPGLLRHSLESFGFDVGKTISDYFGFSLKWASGGLLSDYMTLVSALFHNGELTVEEIAEKFQKIGE